MQEQSEKIEKLEKEMKEIQEKSASIISSEKPKKTKPLNYFSMAEPVQAYDLQNVQLKKATTVEKHISMTEPITADALKAAKKYLRPCETYEINNLYA